MTCTSCKWASAPADERRDRCIACSQHEYEAHRWNTNELSNKGQCVESFDNHSAAMVDDRDVCSEVRPEYLLARARSIPGTEHPADGITRRTGVKVDETAYDYFKTFLCELTSMTEFRACLFLSIVKGEEKVAFASRHGRTPSFVNREYQAMLLESPTLANFILLTNGTLEGTRGRKKGTVVSGGRRKGSTSDVSAVQIMIEF